MNTPTNATKIVPAITVPEGAGVLVNRTIGSPTLRNCDPFMLLDHISSENPDDYIAGFPSHPHRGFNTFTYMIDGDFEHKDSMGNTGKLGPGGAQWMKAASGIIHSEIPIQQNGLMRGFQLWINLPAANKMDTPEYQEYHSAAFPIVKTSDYRAKVLIGSFADSSSPITDNITHVTYADVQLHPGKAFDYILPLDYNNMLYLFEGGGYLDSQSNDQPGNHEISANTLVVSGYDEVIKFVAGDGGARFLLISGKPINETIAQQGPFVMNTYDEIEQAMADFQSNSFVRDRASVNRNK